MYNVFLCVVIVSHLNKFDYTNALSETNTTKLYVRTRVCLLRISRMCTIQRKKTQQTGIDAHGSFPILYSNEHHTYTKSDPHNAYVPILLRHQLTRLRMP